MKPILQYDLKGNFIREFRSAEAAARAIGMTDGSNISGACRGKYITAGGYQFSYKYTDPQILKDMENTNTKPVAQMNKLGEVVAIYDSISAASRATGYAKSNICACVNKRIKSTGGYLWTYATDGMTVEAEIGKRVKKTTPRFPFTYEYIRNNNEAALNAIALIKSNLKSGEPLRSAERILRAICGIEVGLEISDGRLTVCFDGGFVIYMKSQPLSDNFIALLARLVLACNKLYQNAGVDYVGIFGGKIIDIVRVGSDLEGMLKERGL